MSCIFTYCIFSPHPLVALWYETHTAESLSHRQHDPHVRCSNTQISTKQHGIITPCKIHHWPLLPGYHSRIVLLRPREGYKVLRVCMSSTCLYNIVNFGLLAAEIISLVWGTTANFNGFRVLAALLHGTVVVGVSQTLRRWTEGATYIQQGGHHVGHWPTF